MTANQNIEIRRADERGVAEHGWLSSRHTFSFAHYYDPAQVGFSDLLVINDDRVAPGMGFGTHPHRDMEIITYVLAGEVAHRDSMGNGSVIRPGEVQRMSAGTGVRHSEQNPSRTTPLHLLQIWIVPDRAGYPPSYEQKAFPDEERAGRLRLVASPDGAGGSVTIHQDARLYVGTFDDGERATFYAGAATVELYRTETAHYRDNLQMDPPQLWVVLRPVESDPPYELAMVTADPAEGEGMTEAGANVVEPLPMPVQLQEAVAAFVAEHHVEREFVKRKRDRANPDALAQRGPATSEDRK